jgi:hypothetical protein
MRVIKEEVTEEPSEFKAGELIKNYQCTYCKSVRATAFKISTKDKPEDYKTLAQKVALGMVIRVEITAKEGTEYFEFESPTQAKKFLEKYSD